jgi:hypothetical protein
MIGEGMASSKIWIEMLRLSDMLNEQILQFMDHDVSYIYFVRSWFFPCVTPMHTTSALLGCSYICRVARLFIFRPKIPIRVSFGGPWKGKCLWVYFYFIWNILLPFGIHSLWSFGIFPVLVYLDQSKSGNPVHSYFLRTHNLSLNPTEAQINHSGFFSDKVSR